MAIKYQQRIHKAFAEKLNEASKVEFEEMLKQFPKVRAEFKPLEDEAAIEKGNFEICKFFYLESETKEGFEFKNPRKKTVTETVRANVRAYQNILDTLEVEEDEEFSKIYKSLQKEYEKYFEVAAERCLGDYYGEEYTKFAEEFTKEEEAAQKKRVDTRKANQAK